MRVDYFIAQSIQSIPDTQSPLVPLAFVENLLFFGHLKFPTVGPADFRKCPVLDTRQKLKKFLREA